MLKVSAVIAAMSFIAQPAFADGVAVVLHSDAWGVNQVAIAGAIAPMRATAEATNIAALSSIEGSGIGTAFAHADATGVNQIALAGALARGCGRCGKTGVATATATNIAGLTSIDVQTARIRRGRGTTYIHAGASASYVNQIAGALAIAGKNATAAATNLAAVTTVSVNVD